jgi:pimeloyl-ACP methyl ester carboxylesterase
MKRLSLLLGACAVPLMPAPALSAEPPVACEALERHPVVFVHGSGLDAGTWEPMRAAFVAAGYHADWLLAVNLLPNDGDNARAAERFIAPAVDELLQRASAEAGRAGCRVPARVDLIAHSMGGVSSRWYAAKIAPRKVRTLVGIAPANHGTNSLCGYQGEGNRQMCPAFAAARGESALQVDLNGTPRAPADETPFGGGEDSPDRKRIAAAPGEEIGYFTIRLALDPWIKPESSAVLDGAGGRAWPLLPSGVVETTPGNLLWPDVTGHDGLPRDATLIRVVIALLSATAG